MMLREEENMKQEKLLLNVISIGSQTEEFLLFTAVQKRLQDVYTKFKELQDNYDEAVSKIDYLEYKIQYLESSLFETTYIFRHDRVDRNLENLREIQQLNEIIEKERKQLESIQNFVISRISYGQDDREQNNVNTKNVQTIQQIDQQIQLAFLPTSRKQASQRCVKNEIKKRNQSQEVIQLKNTSIKRYQDRNPSAICSFQEASKKQSQDRKNIKISNSMQKQINQNLSVEPQRYKIERIKLLSEVSQKEQKEIRYLQYSKKQKGIQQQLINREAQLKYKHFIDQFGSKNKYEQRSILQDQNSYQQLFKEKKQTKRQWAHKLSFSSSNKINSLR